MKIFNIVLSLLFAFVIVACDPMDDYQDELDSRQDATNEYKVHISSRSLLNNETYNSTANAYSLTEEDYSQCEKTKSLNYFSSEVKFEEYVNEVLNIHYGNNASTVYISYNYNEGNSETEEIKEKVTTVRFINDTLAWEVFINYTLIPTDETLNFQQEYTLTSTDYTELCEQGFSNFDSSVTEEETVEYINLVIKTNRPNDLAEGDIWKVNYAVWTGSYDARVMFLKVTL